MILYLVRHASAEARQTWGGDDRLRPLDGRGLRQAEELVERLGRREFRRIVSSPYVRCVETVVPLAHARGLAVEHAEALGEGASAEAALALFRSAGMPLVACVHGELAEEVLGEAARAGSAAVVELRDEDLAVRELLIPAS